MTQRTHRLRKWLSVKWCSWTHGGGTIERDPLDRINWRCLRCGRWSDPISRDDEAAMTDAAIKRKALR